jgi:hypothetical protein
MRPDAMTVRRTAVTAPSEQARYSVSHDAVGLIGHLMKRRGRWYATSSGGELTGPARTRRADALADLIRWLDLGDA